VGVAASAWLRHGADAPAGSGFTIEHVEEPGDTDPPLDLALRARRVT
jgi:hypothetical protein